MASSACRSSERAREYSLRFHVPVPCPISPQTAANGGNGTRTLRGVHTTAYRAPGSRKQRAPFLGRRATQAA
jgi:hypothetical protein